MSSAAQGGDGSNLDYINSHREACGHALFRPGELTPEQEARHLDAIAQSAPYGNDPWGEYEEETRDWEVNGNGDLQES